jgi:hypothetical protein
MHGLSQLSSNWKVHLVCKGNYNQNWKYHLTLVYLQCYDQNLRFLRTIFSSQTHSLLLSPTLPGFQYQYKDKRLK